jgi:ABC-type bacteriocin/lantibiotic exporter with double-glycine peptidase domain
MNLVYELFSQFISKEKTTAIILILASFIINIIQTGGISFITANIINFIKDGKVENAWTYFYYFVAFSIVFLVFYSTYKHYQVQFLTKMRQVIRTGLISNILEINNENFSDMNFNKLNSPINRMSSVIYFLLNSVINYLLPNITFLIIIMAYFLYYNIYFGIGFIISNILLLLYAFSTLGDLYQKNIDYESVIIRNEYQLVDILNNMDKIISRGQTKMEIDQLWKRTDTMIEVANKLYTSSNIYEFVSVILLFVILFCSIGYLIFLVFHKKLDVTIFITFFTILLMYRDRMTSFLLQVNDYMDFWGRINIVMKNFEDMKYKERTDNLNGRGRGHSIAPIELDFHKIEFQKVTFKYDKSENYIFKDKDFTVNTKNKIIGITGLSGNGKSTFAKLLLKMYHPSSGAIFVDGKNLEEVDTDYIRENITYVNQSSKLFDKKIIENILYGCNDVVSCNNHLSEVMKYQKIRDLYKNIDIHTKSAGSLGENLSGGQRQIVNVISGLINPAKILILDEPTNALDPALKAELISLIRDFKKYKNCIMIITHDSAMYPLFHEKISM